MFIECFEEAQVQKPFELKHESGNSVWLYESAVNISQCLLNRLCKFEVLSVEVVSLDGKP